MSENKKVSEKLSEFNRIMRYAAHETAAKNKHRLDSDDLYQDACVLLLEFINNPVHRELTAEQFSGKFRAHLWWVLGHRVRVRRPDDPRRHVEIHADTLGAREDRDLALAMEARAVLVFMRELRSSLDRVNRRVLDTLLDEPSDAELEEAQQPVLSAAQAARRLGVCRSAIHNRLKKIRVTAKWVAAKLDYELVP